MQVYSKEEKKREFFSPLRNHRLEGAYRETRASQVALMVKNPPANAGDVRDAGSTPGSGRVPGGGRGNPLHYSCWEKSHGQRSLVGYSLCGHKELGMTEATTRTGRPRVRKSGIFCLSTVAVGMSLCSSLRLSKAQVPHIWNRNKSSNPACLPGLCWSSWKSIL